MYLSRDAGVTRKQSAFVADYSVNERLTLILRVRHIWQPLEGFPQYTILADLVLLSQWLV